MVDGLRFSLRACGTLVLCCSAGPTGLGWESPAPFSRVWCLFEVYVAITEAAHVIVKLATNDMVEFQKALNKNGMERVDRALAGLDARKADASVDSDKEMILHNIEQTVGLDGFNSRVRESMREEYKRIATSAGMR